MSKSKTTDERPRWQWQQERQCPSRWTQDQIEELKAELNRRHKLNQLWEICADALGSLQFDLIDAKREKPVPEQTTDFDAKRVERIWELDEAVRQIARMKLFPDDKVNRMTLAAAIKIARDAIHE